MASQETYASNHEGKISEQSEPAPFRILSVDGGGYLGLATAAFVEGIEAHYDVKFHERFDFFCGTSTGAIIALGLAAGKTGKDLVALYKEYGPLIFPPPTGIVDWAKRKLNGKFIWAKYRNDGLRLALKTAFGELTLGDLHDKGTYVLIPAFDVMAGSPRIFKTDHSSNLSLDNKLKIWEVALASSSAPTYFPTTKIQGVSGCFCDGGVVANSPALMGFVEAQFELQKLPSTIRLLSLSTPRKHLADHPDRANLLNRGFWQWRNEIFDVLVDSNSSTSHRILERLARSCPNGAPRYFRLPFQNTHKHPIDLVTKSVTDDLIALGAREAASNQVRPQVNEIIGEA